MKDLVVFIPSRSNPHGCMNTITMLYKQSSSSNNFDIVCIVDDDEVSMYNFVMEQFPKVIWKHPPHAGPNSKYINKIIFETVENNDYTFNWHTVDDMVSLSDKWDKNILKFKDIYPDGFYSCFSSDPMSRNLNAMNSCFRAPCFKWIHGNTSPLVEDPVELIYHYHEMLPICTKKWRMALRKFYDDDYTGPDIVFLNASLAHVLSKEFGYSRHLMADFKYVVGPDSHRASKVLFQGLNRDQFYYKYARENKFELIRPIAEFVSKEIWQHYRDVMDKPRGIGKYAI